MKSKFQRIYEKSYLNISESLDFGLKEVFRSPIMDDDKLDNFFRHSFQDIGFSSFKSWDEGIFFTICSFEPPKNLPKPQDNGRTFWGFAVKQLDNPYFLSSFGVNACGDYEVEDEEDSGLEELWKYATHLPVKGTFESSKQAETAIDKFYDLLQKPKALSRLGITKIK